MVEVTTPRGSVRAPGHQVVKARDRLFRLSPERRAVVADRARAALDRRDSRRAAAIVAAAAALAALAVPVVAL